MKKLPKITALILTLSLACGCSEVFPDRNASGKDTSAYTLPPDPVSSEAPSDNESEETGQLCILWFCVLAKLLVHTLGIRA